MIRPASIVFFICFFLFSSFAMVYSKSHRLWEDQQVILHQAKGLVSALGVSDLCITTEARYTRHPAVTDRVVPYMDHPGAIEHFPSGSFLLQSYKN